MKTRFSLMLCLTIFAGISFLFYSCNKKDEAMGSVTYYGTVVYAKTTTPFPDLEVKLTDGSNVNTTTKTNSEGFFSVRVDLSTINGNYYFLVGDATCVQKKVNIPGWGQAEIDLGVIEVEGPTLPLVETNPVSIVSGSSAIAGGNVISDGRLTITARGVCYSKSEYPSLEEGLYTKDGQGLGEFESNLKNLETNSTYYVRAYATNVIGTAYGKQISFSTTQGIPSVTTLPASDITYNSALICGKIDNDGGATILDHGFCWGKTKLPTINDNIQSCNNQVDFAYTLTKLDKNTTYYVRAYAKNNNGLAYGNEISFITIEGLPQVSTNDISDIQFSSATCGGNVKSDGGYKVIHRGVCWSSMNAAPTIEDNHTQDGEGRGSFISHITNLTADNTYYIRAYATNQNGTVYGEQKMFSTPKEEYATTVVTLDATNITSTTAILNGEIANVGYPEYTEKGFCYSTSPAPSIYNTKKIIEGKGAGKFSTTINIDINVVDKYYVRAYAIQNTKVIYGEEISFTPYMEGASVNIGQVSNVGVNSVSVSATVTNAGTPAYSKRGFCYSTYTQPDIQSGNCFVINENASSTGTYTMTIDNLQSNTQYYVRAYVEWLGHYIYSNTLFFQTQENISVEIFDKLVQADCAVKNGEITWSGQFLAGIYTSVSFVSLGFVYDTQQNPEIGKGNAISVKYSGSEIYGTNRLFYSNISDLSNGVTYYVRAWVQTSFGYIYSSQVTILQNTVDPVIQTYAPTQVEAVTSGNTVLYWKAFLQAVLFSDGLPHMTDWGFVYGTNPTPTANDGSSIMVSKEKHIAISGTDYYAFGTNVTGLQANKIYYVRAYAKTVLGYTYAGVQSFSTY